MRKITIFFDYEGKWGMPKKHPYNLSTTTDAILAVLKKHNVKAVFNSCGIISKEHPEIMKKISNGGHEISAHGFEHENFYQMDNNKFAQILKKIESHSLNTIGKKPLGFRFPYLLNPQFYSESKYKVLSDFGYKWTSNRQIRFIPELMRVQNQTDAVTKYLYKMNAGKFLFLYLNKSVFFDDYLSKNWGIPKIANWLIQDKNPFEREGILEIPVLSTLDCFLFGLPVPNESSSDAELKTAFEILKDEFDLSQNYFNLNFHDWIVGTSNRIDVMDKIIGYIKKKKDIKFVTSEDIMVKTGPHAL